MKTFIAVVLIVVGIVTLANYPNLGKNGAETAGAVFGVLIVTFLPAILFIRSESKKKDPKN